MCCRSAYRQGPRSESFSDAQFYLAELYDQPANFCRTYTLAKRTVLLGLLWHGVRNTQCVCLGSTEATGVVSMCPVEQKCGMFGGVLAPGVIGVWSKLMGLWETTTRKVNYTFGPPAAATGYLNNDAAYVISYYATKNIL